jgi:drug/metabolite transporter (DMT)-like permease
LTLALLAISWSAILIRLCDAPALGIAFYRLLFATLGTLPLMARSRESGLRLRSALSWPAAAAGLCLAVHFGSWIRSLDLTSVASAVLLANLHPLLSGYAGRRWLGDTLSMRTVAALVLALVGAGFVVAGDWGAGEGRLAGDLLAVLGAVTVSAYLLIGRSLRRRVALGSYLTGVYATATLVLGLACRAWGVPLGGYRAADYGWIVLMAVGPHLLGHNLLNWAVRRLPAHVVQATTLGEPVLATLYAALLFSEAPAWGWYAGTACVGAGIAWMAREEWQRQRSPGVSS